ncbi:MAG: Crp/Fnr family transcriptional regulator [Anaerolineales bacterium]|jgi:CRP-like cAMP-binding protein
MISPELLRRFPFFSFMDDKQLKAVAMIAEEKNYDNEVEIVVYNSPAEKLFFLVEGNASYYYIVTSEHDPYYKQEYFISDFNPGEIFGISALIEPYVFTASVRAEKNCHLIEIDASALRALCEVDMQLSCGLMRAVAKAAMERLQHTRVQLIAATS